MYDIHDKSAYESLIDGYISRLPAALADVARTGTPADCARELRALLADGGKTALRALTWCYVIDNERVRPALIEILRDAPFEQNYFTRIRQIFKAAEFRRDGEIFGLLAYRFEKQRARHLRRYQRRANEQPFYEPTRQYLRRRVWRSLRRMGQDDSPDFVKMAVGVLLPFTDQDRGQVRTQRYYRWRAPDITIDWDLFAGFWAFNQLLYGRSERYRPDPNGRAFRCRAPYRPDGPAPVAREESFPHLWERTPQGLLHLLDESSCERVHEFAAKALMACTSFIDHLDASVAAMLLSRPYDVTAQAGFTLAKRLYSRTFDDDQRIELISAVAECRLSDARRQARAWFDVLRPRLSEHTRLWAELVTSSYPDNREYARLAIRTAFFSADVERVLIARMIAVIKRLGADASDSGNNERIADIGATLLACFAGQLSTVGMDVIRDLLEHPAAAAQELGGRLLLGHRDLARAVPDRALYALLGSPHEAVRGIGAQLMAGFTEHALAEHHELLLLLSIHQHADLRVAIRPVIQRLAERQPAFAARMVAAFVEQLMSKQPKGVHSHLLVLLAEDLRAHLGQVTKERVLQLLHHKHPQAQELGGILLAQNLGPDELSVAELVKLASHEILAIRQGAWAMCEKAINRLKRAMPTAIRLLDAKWQDSREFAFGLFRDKFTRQELTPEILVAICDSVRPDVQGFGRTLITQYFEENHGYTYLTRLSEHPSVALQLFASSYLEQYASGQPARIQELEAFFLAVLSRVNQGRVTKQRAIAFLRREALDDPATATIAARIFARQSATIAVGEREAMISAMVDIARRYPDIARDTLPIRTREPVVRDRWVGSKPADRRSAEDTPRAV